MKERFFKQLDEKVFWNSLECQILGISANGKNGVWLFQKNEEEYTWYGDCQFPFDVLEDYPLVRQQIGVKSLLIHYEKNKFWTKLVYKERAGGI